MIDITFVLLGIVMLFAVFVALRSIFAPRICALCGAVVVAWVTLLVLFYVGYDIDQTLVGILMGGSIVGALYLLEQKLAREYHMFRLPFFLTLVAGVYFVLTRDVVLGAVWVVLAVWVLSLVLYFGRTTKSLSALGKKVIECCKNW